MKWLTRTGIGLSIVLVAAVACGPLAIQLREREELRALPPGVPGRLVEVGGQRVHVVESGEGPALVLVHGFGASTHDFEEFVMRPFAKTHRVIAVDLFGNGWSERSDDFAYGWDLWSEQLAGTLDALGVPRASVLGHSMGGAVCAFFAARHPERVDRLVLADAVYPRPPSEAPPVFRGLRTPLLGEFMLGAIADPSAPGFGQVHRERAIAWARIRGTRHGMLRFIRNAQPEKLAAAYPKITAPTLVFHGTADAFVTFATMKRSLGAIPNARLVAADGGSHFPFRDDVGRFVHAAQDFLQGEK